MTPTHEAELRKLAVEHDISIWGIGSAENAQVEMCNRSFMAGARAGWLVRGVADLAFIEDLEKAYAEDLFTPLPKYGTPEHESQDNDLVTRASAHMGRHLTGVLKRDIRDLDQSGEGDGP